MARKYDRVPELSLADYVSGGADARARFIEALDEGFRYFGFIILKDHGVSRDLLARAYEMSRAFFALPEADKRDFMRGVDGQRGYTPFGREHAKTSKVGDLKEFFHIGREFSFASPLANLYPQNVWPAQPARFRETFLGLFDALEEAGFAMLEAPSQWELPNIIGLPMAAQHGIVIRNSEPQIFQHQGRTMRTPQVDLIDLGAARQAVAVLTGLVAQGFVAQRLVIRLQRVDALHGALQMAHLALIDGPENLLGDVQHGAIKTLKRPVSKTLNVSAITLNLLSFLGPPARVRVLKHSRLVRSRDLRAGADGVNATALPPLPATALFQRRKREQNAWSEPPSEPP